MGTGLLDGSPIPCYGVNGLVPAQGDTLSCTLRLGVVASSTPPIVVVKNFREISVNSKVRILLSGVQNPSASYTILLKIFVD